MKRKQLEDLLRHLAMRGQCAMERMHSQEKELVRAQARYNATGRYLQDIRRRIRQVMAELQ
jgi:hypothetical protein